METKGVNPSKFGLQHQGLGDVGTAYWNLPPAALMEHFVVRGEGQISMRGSVAVTTGEHTGRSPKDKFIVEGGPSGDVIDWGAINRPIERKYFDQLRSDMIEYMRGKEVFVQDLLAGADAEYTMPVRVMTELAWQSLFARTMLVRPAPVKTLEHEPQFTIIDLAHFKADPKRHGTRSGTFIVLDFEQRMVLIGGTEYGGEIKKSAFTILNHLLPDRKVLPMHCSANIGENGDTALFFGLSGTGKTTLSADPDRLLIGDDEHGWSDTGVFNFEGGCYAKCINLSKKNEPQIYNALRFASVLENVVINPDSRAPDFADDSLTENTRAAYPLDYIDNVAYQGVGDHPRNVVFLTCDAFGVLPPISRLNASQAMYHFLSGYTAKVAGTEAGVTEPQATFSTLFGAPFFTRRPMVYAKMLGDRLARHNVRCWLVNTGWCGGPYGVGRRMNLPYTREMLTQALSGHLDDVEYTTDPVFGLEIPLRCPPVPPELLNPRSSWDDSEAYDAKAAHLAGLFRKNFEQFDGVTPEVRAAGPS